MIKNSTPLQDLYILQPKVFGDSRGFFFESYNQKIFNVLIGCECQFVQDNHSKSKKGVLRGLHYQLKKPQAKLVRVTLGSIFDVVVDLRKDSSTFGQWYGVELSAENKNQLWIPTGFAHGFQVLSDESEMLYKATEFYDPKDERCILWNDSDLKIQWPLNSLPLLSEKDQKGLRFIEAEY